MNCPVKTLYKFLDHLKTFAGLPVPEPVKWIDGKPDFRQIDEDAWIAAVQKRLCGICGKRLGEYSWWIGGDNCLARHLFLDLAMHRPCAEASIQLCPFLNGTRPTYRGALAGHPQQDSSGRPDRLHLMRGHTAQMEMCRMDGALIIHAGKTLTRIKTI